MSHNRDTIYEVINALEAITTAADSGLERLKNSGTGGGEISPNTKHALGAYIHKADLAIEAFNSKANYLADLVEAEVPIKELRQSLENKNLRAKLPPKAQVAWDELKNHIDHRPTVVEKATP
ncbi:hypothetical protein LCGC14_0820500 [marine sediment metagenome]|uniref:Uncharacterized protein n=1 Tax=marine sediment metagenome TaxID=412755 RepID=A0A0F9Q491_9ZZZZ